MELPSSSLGHNKKRYLFVVFGIVIVAAAYLIFRVSTTKIYKGDIAISPVDIGLGGRDILPIVDLPLLSPPPPPADAPAAPTGLTVNEDETTSNSVSLKWVDHADNENDFFIYVTDSAGTTATRTEAKGIDTNSVVRTTVEGLEPNAEYHFTVRAHKIDCACESASSEEVVAKTLPREEVNVILNDEVRGGLLPDVITGGNDFALTPNPPPPPAENQIIAVVIDPPPPPAPAPEPPPPAPEPPPPPAPSVDQNPVVSTEIGGPSEPPPPPPPALVTPAPASTPPPPPALVTPAPASTPPPPPSSVVLVTATTGSQVAANDIIQDTEGTTFTFEEEEKPKKSSKKKSSSKKSSTRGAASESSSTSTPSSGSSKKSSAPSSSKSATANVITGGSTSANASAQPSLSNTKALSNKQLYGAAIKGKTGPELLLYPVVISAANGLYYLYRKRRK